MYQYYIKFREWDSSLLFWIVWGDCRVLSVPMNFAKMDNSSFHIWINYFGTEINQMLAHRTLGKGACQYRNDRPCQEKLNNFLMEKNITGTLQWITRCCIVPPSGLLSLLGVCIFHCLNLYNFSGPDCLYVSALDSLLVFSFIS